MLKEQIEKSFYLTCPKRTNCLVNLTEDCKQGEFKLCDEIACRTCRICNSDASQRENLRVTSSQPVYVIWMNQVLSYLKNRVVSCDAILSNNEIMVFLEMTCSKAKYVNSDKGKRSKAIDQLVSTINLFRNNSDLSDYMYARSVRYAIFSWKDTSQPRDEHDPVETGFTPFTDFSDAVYSIDNYRNLDNGFTFKEIRYPDVLRIDDL